MPRKASSIARESDLAVTLRQLGEIYPMCQLVGKSYVLSRVWAWMTKIEVSPRVRIPVPRFLTVRDP